MRIKKIAILEAVANAAANTNTSNTTSTNTSNTTNTQNKNTNKVDLPKPEDIEKSKKAVEDLDKKVGEINKEVKDGPMGAFLKGGDGLTENDYPGGEDYGDIPNGRDIEVDADDYEDQQAFLNDLSKLDESIKSKRKVIKTIKVKDLKNG
jgi:hypothetical protein